MFLELSKDHCRLESPSDHINLLLTSKTVAKRKRKASVLLEVADELVAEFADPNNSISSPDQVLLFFQYSRAAIVPPIFGECAYSGARERFDSVPADKRLTIFDKIFSAYHEARGYIRADLLKENQCILCWSGTGQNSGPIGT
ncbi:hypothetical protein L6164_023983 [Bauhinia variegata]|uniref:Uncharacterized protein n=1 Tax=Bauhinia variegata TaxID=167791 RepID=A0ACB9LX16_BAUVA|nr:hypothetical protein L6164_023983 [Bauhinia variegata]